jgi:hypothetical protein
MARHTGLRNQFSWPFRSLADRQRLRILFTAFDVTDEPVVIYVPALTEPRWVGTSLPPVYLPDTGMSLGIESHISDSVSLGREADLQQWIGPIVWLALKNLWIKPGALWPGQFLWMKARLRLRETSGQSVASRRAPRTMPLWPSRLLRRKRPAQSYRV